MRPLLPPLTILFCLLLANTISAQQFPVMMPIPGGNFVAGGGYQYQLIRTHMHLIGEDSNYARLNAESPAIGEVPMSNNPEKAVTVSTFEIAAHETSNKEYRDFLIDSLLSPAESKALQQRLKRIKSGVKGDSIPAAYALLFERATNAGLLPDEHCWENDWNGFMMNPYTVHYFKHPAFDPYPVVGVNWHQANAYCAWLSTRANKALIAKGKPIKPDFRLPTEMEWEYAAGGIENAKDHRNYPWSGWSPFGLNGKFMANVKNGPGDYAADSYMSTSPVKSFYSNGFGLYNMAGNVSEWTLDVFRYRHHAMDMEPELRRNEPELVEAAPAMLKLQERVIKGGSWADYIQAAMCGSRAGMDENRGYSRVGFRVARTVVANGKAEF